MTSDAYMDRYDQLETKSASLQCQICQVDIKRNFLAIKKHLHGFHSMDIDQYGKKYHLKKYEVTIKMKAAPSTDGNCTKSDAAIAQILAMDNEIEVKKEQKRLGPKSKTKPIHAFKPTTPCIQPGPKSRKRKANASEQLATPEPNLKRPVIKKKMWFDGTEYQCHICSEMFFQMSSFVNHILSEHNLSEDDYIDRFKKIVTTEAVYICQICNETVEHTKIGITR